MGQRADTLDVARETGMEHNTLLSRTEARNATWRAAFHAYMKAFRHCGITTTADARLYADRVVGWEKI